MRLPDEYRREAAHIRAMAGETAEPIAKEELLKMAAAFERLAMRAEDMLSLPSDARAKAGRRAVH